MLKQNITKNNLSWPLSPFLGEHTKRCVFLILVTEPHLRLSWIQILATYYMSTAS